MEFVRKIDAKFVYVEQVASESAIKLVSSCVWVVVILAEVAEGKRMGQMAE